MKIPLGILAIVVVILLLSQYFAPRPDPATLQPRTDLPWQITRNADGTSRVFDLDLGHATLADAMAKFGALEGLAVFAPQDRPTSLEAFFGTVEFGPLRAKVVAQLAAGGDELAGLQARSSGREASPTGDWKYPLRDDPAAHAGRRVTAISYVPGTRGLDQAFFRERLGEPAATLQENEHAVSWFYPGLGLSVLIDDKGREVLEYQAPRDFVLPDGVTPNPAAP